jgi:hypothetical protein
MSSNFYNIRKSSFGSLINGSFIFGGIQNYISQVPRTNLGQPRVSQSGQGAYGNRQYGRSYLYRIRQISEQTIPRPTVTISSATDAFIGVLRSEIQFPIISSLEFFWGEHGCEDFTLVLGELPQFKILPRSRIEVALNDQVVYAGYLEEIPEPTLKTPPYEYKGFGYIKQLSDIAIPGGTGNIFPFGQRAGDVVDSIMTQYIQPNTQIKYNASKINKLIGTPLAEDIEFDTSEVGELIQALADHAGAEWGVDEIQELYFRGISETPSRVFFEGYNSTRNDLRNMPEAVRNQIQVERKLNSGSGREVIAILNNLESQRRYGVINQKLELPGFFGITDGEIIGQKVLDELSEPRVGGTIRGVPLIFPTDVIKSGPIRVVTNTISHPKTIMRNIDIWNLSGSGDATVSNNTTVVNDSFKSLEIAWTSESNTITIQPDYVGLVTLLRITARSIIAGDILEIGYGESSSSQMTGKMFFELPNIWKTFEFTTPDFKALRQISFTTKGDTSSTVYIDAIDVLTTKAEHYTLKFVRGHYTLGQQNSAIIDVGPQRQEDSDYIAAALKLSKNNRSGLLT